VVIMAALTPAVITGVTPCPLVLDPTDAQAAERA
jgi:hypothetical protein